MKSLLPPSDFDDMYSFSPLHKAVLGLDSFQLEREICSMGNNIDAFDRNGRTALSWAVQRRDSRTAQKLINCGADCNQIDKQGYSPLMYATLTSLDCTELLLNARADTSIKLPSTGLDLLQCTAEASLSDGESVRIAQALVKAGSDVNAFDRFGTVPLHKAAFKNKPKLAKYLVSCGADYSVHETHNFNALFYAILGNNHSIIDFLLFIHQDHTAVLEDFGSIMHVAAEFADSKTLSLLANGNLKHRNINIKNKYNLTPTLVAMQHEDVDTEWKDAFESLLDSIDENKSPEARPPVCSQPDTSNSTSNFRACEDNRGDSSDDDEFLDAVERQV